MRKTKYFINSLAEDAIKALKNLEYFDEYEKKQEAQEKEIEKFYNALINGTISYFYQKTNRNLIVWHNSTREGVLLQESHSIFENGELIPLYHANINSFQDLIREDGFLTDEYILTEGEKEE